MSDRMNPQTQQAQQAQQARQAMTREVERFLFREARLIDERRLTEWLDLFTTGAVYWLPIDETDEPGTRVSLIHDNDLRRRERVYRLLETHAPAQDPPSRTQHFISNVEVAWSSDTACVAYSSQIVYEIRAGQGDYRQLGLGEQRSFAARCMHRLTSASASASAAASSRTQGDWKIEMKKMVLLNRDVAMENLTFIF